MTFDIPTEVITPLRLESLSPSTRDNELNINAGESPIISFGVTLNTDEQINKHLAQIMIGYRHAETGVLSPRILLEYQKALWWEDSYVFQQTGDIDFKWSPSGLWMPWAEGIRPVKTDARHGEHIELVQKAEEKIFPLSARSSIFGVDTSVLP